MLAVALANYAMNTVEGALLAAAILSAISGIPADHLTDDMASKLQCQGLSPDTL